MSWITRLKHSWNPRRLDAELSEEYRDHIERRAAEYRNRGLSDEEAWRRAELTFGNRTALRERSREVRLWPMIDETLQDLRYGWRGLLASPVFALTAILSLGLAIGANTAIYSLIDVVILRPLPVPEPDRLFAVESPGEGLVSYPLYEELQAAAAPLAKIALVDSPGRMEARVNGAASPVEEVLVQFTSPNVFDVVGIPPAAGRLQSPDAEGIVLSHEYWERRLNEDPHVVGRTLLLGGRSYPVAGVAREGFTGVEPGKFVDVWMPITLGDPGMRNNPDFRAFHLLGRLASDATRSQVEARLQPAFGRNQQSQPQLNRGGKISIVPGASGISAFRRTFSRPLWMLLGVAACILLIACANVASLLLARSSVRAAEMVLRAALGAGRGRLIRQLLTESGLIGVLAGAAGWILARVAAPALAAMVSRQNDPVRLDLAVDARVLLFSTVLCALATLLFGMAPAWQMSAAALRSSTSSLRLGRMFVGVQVAFAFCLVTAGTGFLFSLRNLSQVDTGFDPKGVTVLTIANDFGPAERDRQLLLLRQIQMKAAALPGAEDAASAWMPMFSGGRRAQRILLPGQRLSANEETFYRVSPGYFKTLRTPLIAGRDLTLHDDDTEPIATIVNLAFAHRYFGGDSSPLGKEFRRDDGVRHQIVGIAANSLFGDLRNGADAIAYMPMKPPRAFTLYIRSHLDAPSVAHQVEQEAKTFGGAARVTNITTLDALVRGTILRERVLAAIGGAFALLGLLLAAIGMFGLLNYTVLRRTREIGIRAALGAGRWPLCVLIVQDSLASVAGGLIVGLAGSLALIRVSRTLLFGIEAVDVRVIGTAALVLMAATFIAGGLPLRRTTAIDPAAALRHE